MNNEHLVSIVIPSYNTPSEFMKECLKSVFAQSYRKLEVLLIDDGSKKEFANYMDEMIRIAPKDIQVRIFHRNNTGASASRNYGLDHSTGEFVCFVDADDILHPRFIEYLLISIREYDADFSTCDFKMIKDMSQFIISKCECSSTLYKGVDIWKYTNTGYIWNKLFRRRNIENIHFREDLSAGSGEDVVFMNQFIEKINSCAAVSEKLYFYRVNGSNVTSHLKALNYRSCRDAFKQRLSNKYVKPDQILKEKIWQDVANLEIKYMVCLVEEKNDNWKEEIVKEKRNYTNEYRKNLLKSKMKLIQLTNYSVFLPDGLFVIYLNILSKFKKQNNKRKLKKWSNR